MYTLTDAQYKITSIQAQQVQCVLRQILLPPPFALFVIPEEMLHNTQNKTSGRREIKTE